MNASMVTIQAAEMLALQDTSLQAALHDWHNHKGRLEAEDRDKPFDRWLRDLLISLSDHMKETDPEPSRIVKALEINAVGDKLALYWAAQMARGHGLQTDTNCYVEDGMVYSSVWLKGDEPAWVKIHAEEVAGEFQKAGYATDICVDEEDDREVTINASIDFALYIKEG